MTARQTVLRGLTAERDDLAEDAARLDAYITGDAFDGHGRAAKVLLLRQHAAMIWNLDRLDQRISRFIPEAATA
jgi:hypothetical protein